MSIPVNILTAAVPASFCPSNIQDDWPTLVALLSASLPGSGATYVIGTTTPDPSDNDKPWVRIEASTNRYMGTYYYTDGYWLRPHPLRHWYPSGGMIWYGQEADVATFDGGEVGDITAITGPMWQVKAELAARIPIGAGTLPVSEAVVARGSIGGVDEHNLVLTNKQLPSHTHAIGIDGAGNVGGTELGRLSAGVGALTYSAITGTPNFGLTRARGDSEAIEIDNMPPYYGVYFLVKTARTHYRA